MQGKCRQNQRPHYIRPLFKTHWNTSALRLSAFFVFVYVLVLAISWSANTAWAIPAGTALPTNGGTLTSGEYYLAEDTTLTNDIVIADGAEVTIDLNGKTLSGTGNGSVISVGSSGNTGAQLVLSDTVGGGTITGGNADRGGGIFVSEHSIFTMNGGAITDNSATSKGGGVYVYNAVFTLTNGTISDNSASQGGGVYIDGNVYLPDLVYLLSATETEINEGALFNMTGGSISENSSASGGGVYMYGGSFLLQGGSILDNSASNHGGGIFGCGWMGLYEGGTIAISDGMVSGNTAKEGAGIYLEGAYSWLEAGSAVMTGGVISGNIAEASGGGVYVNHVTFTVSGGQIVSNVAGNTGGGAYIWNKGILAVSGTLSISDNTLTSGVVDNTYIAGYIRHDAGIVYVVDSLHDSAFIGISRAIDAPTVAYSSNSYAITNDDAACFSDDSGRYAFAVRNNTVIYDLSERNLVERLGGLNRYKTMELIAQAAFADGTCNTVIVCRGDKFPDALAASGLAGAFNGQVLLTKTETLSAETAAEITRLGSTQAIVIGDEKSVSAEAYTEIEALLGADNVKRIAGSNRYETALSICESVHEANKDAAVETDTIIISTGTKAADALSASSLVYALNAPMVLVNKSGNLSAEALSVIKELNASRILILGDTASVSAAAESDLTELGLEVVRLGGTNRYKTSIEIADYAVSNLGFSYAHATVTAGNKVKFADALVASALCGNNKSPILLVSSEATSDADISSLFRLYAHDVGTAYVLGSTASVTDEMQMSIEYAIAAGLILD